MRSIAGEEGLVSLLKTAFDGFNVVNQNPLIEVGWLIVYKFSTDVFSMLKFNTYSMFHLLDKSMPLQFIRSEKLADIVLT